MNIFKKAKEYISLEKQKYNDEVLEKQNKSPQKTALKLLAGFFAFMMLFTLLSRTADGLTIAKVETKKTAIGVIKHDITSSGKVLSDSEESIKTLDGLLIDTVAVKEGTTVKKGAELISFDKATSEVMLQKLVNELEVLSLKKTPTDENETAIEKAKRALINANADFDTAVEKGKYAIGVAQESFDEAVSEYDKLYFEYEYKGLIDKRWQDWSDEPVLKKEEITRVYPNVDDEKEQAANKLAVIEARKAMQAASKACSDKRIALDSALKADELEQISQRRALDNAQLGYDEAIKAEEDSQTKTEVDNQGYSIEMKNKQATVQALRKLEKSNWKIYADFDARVIKVLAQEGAISTRGELVSLSKNAAGYKVMFPLDKEQIKWLKEGDVVEVTLMVNGERKPIDAAISKISLASQNGEQQTNDGYELEVKLPKGVYLAGEEALMNFSKQSESYNQCLPISALRSDSGGDDFVLVAEEKDTVMGKESIARKINVKIVDRDSQNMAVESALSPTDMVIISADKMVLKGDRVRV